MQRGGDVSSTGAAPSLSDRPLTISRRHARRSSLPVALLAAVAGRLHARAVTAAHEAEHSARAAHNGSFAARASLVSVLDCATELFAAAGTPVGGNWGGAATYGCRLVDPGLIEATDASVCGPNAGYVPKGNSDIECVVLLFISFSLLKPRAAMTVQVAAQVHSIHARAMQVR